MKKKTAISLIVLFSVLLTVLLACPFGKNSRVSASPDQGYFTGIDVSDHNGTIDWARAKSVGVEFAIIRIGYGDDYKSQDDGMALRNIQECEKYEIPYGIYIYSYAISEKEVESEIAHTLRMIEGHDPVLGVWFDMEDADAYKQRHNFNPYTHGYQLTQFCLQYMRGMKEAGYPLVGVYANPDYFNNVLDYNAIKAEGLIWLAHWRTANPAYPYDMWQYTEQGMTAINGNWFDTNRIDAGSILYSLINNVPFEPEFYERTEGSPLSLGDITGDGRITLEDLSKLKEHITGQLVLEGDAAFCADLNRDEKIGLSDLTAMKKFILETEDTEAFE